MFELKDTTPVAQAHSARIGLGCAFVLLLVEAATLLLGKGPFDVQDLALSALIVMMGSDAASRLWTENRPVGGACACFHSYRQSSLCLR
jgi:hypothetical protein